MSSPNNVYMSKIALFMFGGHGLFVIVLGMIRDSINRMGIMALLVDFFFIVIAIVYLIENREK